MGKFLKHILLEKKESKKAADPHEIMTACFCVMSDSDFNKNNPNGKNSSECDSIINVLKEIALGKRIVGKNSSEVNGITEFPDKYNALAQAYSAAESIRKHFSKTTNYCILTGRSWTKDVEQYSGIENLKKFGIDSYGMKDFNSSDIILTNKSKAMGEASKTDKFLGVSLKKKGHQEKAADPTMLNISVEDVLSNINPKIKREIETTFDDFFNTTIKTNIDKLFPSNGSLTPMFEEFYDKAQKKGSTSPYKNCSSVDEVEAALKNIAENAKNSDWKAVLSDRNGLMAAHPSKDNVRDIFNEALKKKGSVFEKLQKVIDNNSGEIALNLIKIIYKGDLYKLIANDFDFGFCIGKGSYVNKKCIVKPAEYESVTLIEDTLNKLRKLGTPNMTVSKKQKPFDDANTSAKLFFDLNIGNHPITNIEIRYKGSYTSSPQFFATMSPEFKEFLVKGEW